MEADRAHLRIVNNIQRPQRTSCTRSTRSTQRYLMDLAYQRHSGKIYRSAIHHIRHAIGAFRNGSNMEFSGALPKRWSKS